MSGNFGYMGRSNNWDDLDQMWLVGRYGGIMCAIFGDCRLRGVGMVRGANFPSPIDLITLVTLPCDRVIVYSRLDRGMPYTISDGDVMAF